MKKIIISFFILFFISGCWNYKELNEYSIVTGIAIDKSGDKYEVSVLISNSPKNSTDQTSDETQSIVYNGYGTSIFGAIKDIGLISPKELYLQSSLVLVISEDVAKDGVENVVDFFVRFADARKRFCVVIAKDTEAKNTLKIVTPITTFPSQNISDNIKYTKALQGIVSETNFSDLLESLLKEGIDPYINSIIVKGDLKKGVSIKNTETSKPSAYVKIDTVGIFKGDKLVDWATYDESLGINLINNKSVEVNIKIKYKDGYVIVDTTKLKTKVKTSVKNNKPKVSITTSGEARIVEAIGDIDLGDYKTIEKLQNKVNKKIIGYSKKAINLSIKNKSDFLGLGLKFYQNNSKYYKKVKEDFKDNLDKIDYNIDCNMILKNKSSSRTSLEEINDKNKNI